MLEPKDAHRDLTSILPPSCVLGAGTWGIDSEVRQATNGAQPSNGCPLNRLSVPEFCSGDISPESAATHG